MKMLPSAPNRFFRRTDMDCPRYKVATLPEGNPAQKLPASKPSNMKSVDFSELKALGKAPVNEKTMMKVLQGKHRLHNWLVIQASKKVIWQEFSGHIFTRLRQAFLNTCTVPGSHS